MPTDLIWSPSEWLYNGFPIIDEEDKTIDLLLAMEICAELIDSATDYDYTSLGRALHMVHMLVNLQNQKGSWPVLFNGRSGEPQGKETTSAPLELFRTLRDRLQTTEFDSVISKADAGILRLQEEMA